MVAQLGYSVGMAAGTFNALTRTVEKSLQLVSLKRTNKKEM